MATISSCGSLRLLLEAGDNLPPKLVEIFVKGSYLGITEPPDDPFKGTTECRSFDFTILTESQLKLDRDVEELSRAALFAKYPNLKVKETALIKSYKDDFEKKGKRLEEGFFDGEEVSISPSAGKLYKIVHVGTDYLVLETH